MHLLKIFLCFGLIAVMFLSSAEAAENSKKLTGPNSTKLRPGKPIRPIRPIRPIPDRTFPTRSLPKRDPLVPNYPPRRYTLPTVKSGRF